MVEIVDLYVKRTPVERANTVFEFILRIGVSLIVLLFWIGCERGGRMSVTEQQRSNLDQESARALIAAQQAYRQGRFQDALADISGALAHHPQLTDALYLQGRIWSQLQQFDQASESYRNVLDIDPFYETAHYQLGHNAFSRGKFSEALQHYEDELKLLSSSSPEVLTQIGRTLERLERVDEAIATYKEALLIDSSHAIAHLWLAELYQQLGEQDLANIHADAAYAFRPEDPEIRYVIGKSHFQQGDFTSAIAHFTFVIQSFPWHEGAHYNLGRALLATGDRDAGMAYMQKTDSLQFLKSEIGRARQGAMQYPQDIARWQHLIGLLRRAKRNNEAQEAYRVFLYLRGTGEGTVSYE